MTLSIIGDVSDRLPAANIGSGQPVNIGSGAVFHFRKLSHGLCAYLTDLLWKSHLLINIILDDFPSTQMLLLTPDMNTYLPKNLAFRQLTNFLYG